MKLEKCEAENVQFGKVDVLLTLDGMQDALKCAEKLNSLVGEEITLTAEKKRQKRSLNANSYLRVLEGKIADVIGADKNEVHNDMLCRYGQYTLDEDGNIVYCLYRQDIDYRGYESLHLKPTGHTERKGNIDYQWYAVMKPSHEYNTKEMASLIDGVVSEAKELDIETLSPDEIKRLESAGCGT